MLLFSELRLQPLLEFVQLRGSSSSSWVNRSTLEGRHEGAGGTGWATVPFCPAAEMLMSSDQSELMLILLSFKQHNRFVLDCKDKEPDVLFVGDSMVQLLQQYEVLIKTKQNKKKEKAIVGLCELEFLIH